MTKHEEAHTRVDMKKRVPNTPKVQCPRPSCGKWESKVVDGRPWREGYRRQRECVACGHRFYTVEKAA